MEILLFSQEEEVPGEIEQINQMFTLGLQFFHLRKPGLNRFCFESLLRQIKPKFRKRVVIHSHFGLLQKYQIGGIHLTERIKKHPLGMNRLIEKVRSLPGNIRISISCHSLKELVRLKDTYFYATLSPIFDSISKKGYKAQFDLESVKNVLLKTEIKVVALGGCEASKLKILQNMGFWGAGILGAIWNYPDPVKAFNELMTSI